MIDDVVPFNTIRNDFVHVPEGLELRGVPSRASDKSLFVLF